MGYCRGFPLCPRSPGEASIVIKTLGPVGLVVDVVCYFLEVLEVGPEGQEKERCD